jgi:hypothetical protein
MVFGVDTEMSLQQTRDSIGSETVEDTLFELYEDRIHLGLGPMIIQERTPTSGFILDNSAYDILGTSKLGAFSGSYTKTRVENYNNTFIEPFYTDYMFDSASTTGTLNSTLNSITINPGSQYQTSSIFKDATGTKIVNSVELIGATIVSGTLLFSASANSTTNWVSSSGSVSTFTGTTRGSDLRLRFQNLTATTVTMSGYSAYYLLGN